MITRLSLLKQTGRWAPSSTERVTIRSYGSGDVSKGSSTFGKKEHAQEEQFFRKREREELEKYRDELKQSQQKSGKKSPPGSPKKK